MNIYPTNNFYKQSTLPNFKSSIPVYHWVRETNGSFAAVAEIEDIKILQRQLVGLLNKTIKKTPYTIEMMNKAVEYLKKVDLYYSLRVNYMKKTGKKLKPTRSFYDENGGWINNFKDFKPISYLITGTDVDYFNNTFGKDVGIEKAIKPKTEGQYRNADFKMAARRYHRDGLEFVSDSMHQIRDNQGITQALHTKFERIRNTNGKIVGYKFIDLKLLPEKGPTNPFERLRLRDKQ